MMATQTFCSAGVLALATIMGPVAPGYAGEPCCAWVYGKYINLKTGKGRPRAPLRQGQSRTLQVLLTGTVRSLQKQLHHPSAYIRA